MRASEATSNPELRQPSFSIKEAAQRQVATLTVADAKAGLSNLIDQAAESHEPLLISGKRNTAVLLAEDDWRAIQETLFLLSVPGVRESIRKGMDTEVTDCSEEVDW